MAITDVLQSLLIALIVSFLLANLFSSLFSSADESTNSLLTLTLTTTNRTLFLTNDRIKAMMIGRGGGGETTELDDVFCAATAFVADRSSLKVSSGLRLKLYGLYKVATEGACGVPQPSAIKIAARAKWNAWHKLGSMAPEEAMQKYLEIITELYPNWADDSASKRRGGDNNETSSKDTRPMGPDFSSSMHEEESGHDYELDAIHDFTREDSEGHKPLHGAIDQDHIDVAEMLSSTNAEINQKDYEGLAPLHDAVVCEPDDIDPLLVKKNAAKGIQDDVADDDGKYQSDLSHSNWHSI